MGIVIASKMTFNVGAYDKSVDQVSGQYENIGPGQLSLWCLPSAIGLNATLKINGISIVDDQPLAFTGTTGAMSKVDNLLLSQAVAGGRVELSFRNTTGGALTIDYQLDYSPSR